MTPNAEVLGTPRCHPIIRPPGGVPDGHCQPGGLGSGGADVADLQLHQHAASSAAGAFSQRRVRGLCLDGRPDPRTRVAPHADSRQPLSPGAGSRTPTCRSGCGVGRPWQVEVAQRSATGPELRHGDPRGSTADGRLRLVPSQVPEVAAALSGPRWEECRLWARARFKRHRCAPAQPPPRRPIAAARRRWFAVCRASGSSSHWSGSTAVCRFA